MQYLKTFTAFLLAVILLTVPMSAQAASSAAIRAYDDQTIISRDFSGQDLVEAEFSSQDLSAANFSNADLRGAVFNGVTLMDANFHGANLSYSITYLTKFIDTDLTDALFTDAMMLRSSFKNVDITGADFSYAILDGVEQKRLCDIASGTNSKTGVETRESLECFFF